MTVSKFKVPHGHDAWFRAEVIEGIKQANDPNGPRIPHRLVAAEWQRQRARLVRTMHKSNSPKISRAT